MVPSVNVVTGSATCENKTAATNIDAVSRQDKSTPTLPQAAIDWMSCVQQKLEDKGVTGEPLQIILASWREGTQKQYRTYITAWISFCTEHGTNVLQPLL